MRRVLPLAISLAGILYLSLYPFRWQQHAAHARWISYQGPSTQADVVDMVGNVLLYAPLGWALVTTHAVASLRAGLVLALAVGAGLSFAIEGLQLFLPGRFSNLRDVACNALGAMVGMSVGIWWRQKDHTVRGRIPGLVCFQLACWVIACCFPFVPAPNWEQLRQAWRGGGADWADAVLWSATMFGTGRATGWIAAVGGGALGYMFFIPGIHAGWGRIAGYAGGMLLAILSLQIRNREQWWWRTMGLFWMVGLFVRQVGSGDFSADRQAFHWLPFGGLESIPGEAYWRIVVWKLGLYSGAVWTLAQAFGISQGVAMTLAVVAAGEWAQQWLPGRVPESTDILLTGLGSIVVYRLGARERC